MKFLSPEFALYLYLYHTLIFPSKHLLVFKMSWRHLQRVFSVTIFRLPRRLKTSWRHLAKDVFLGRRKIVTLKTSSLKTCLEDVLKTYVEDVLKTCLEEVFKTSWKQTNLNVYIFDLTNLHLTNLYLANLRRIQDALIRTKWFQYCPYFETKAAFLF